MQGCRVVNEEEVRKILESLKIRDRVLVMTGLTFGTRVSEALSLTFGEVSGKFLYIHSKKGNRNVTFPIPDGYKKLVQELRGFYEEKGIEITPKTPLFLSFDPKGDFSGLGEEKPVSRQFISKVLKKICKKLGIEGRVNTHSFRKAFVTRIYELTGKDIVQTQNYSRHKNLSNLQYYIQTTEGTELVNALGWGE